MSHEIDAIYENGVLRPLVPLSLPEHSQVKVTVEGAAEVGREKKAAAQRAAIGKLWEELKALPQHQNNDGWSAKDADDLLYGPQQ